MESSLKFEDSPFFPFADEKGDLKKTYDLVAAVCAAMEAPVAASDRYQEALVLVDTGVARADLLIAALTGPGLINVVCEEGRAAVEADFSAGVADIAVRLHDLNHPEENENGDDGAAYEEESPEGRAWLLRALERAGPDAQALNLARGICVMEHVVQNGADSLPDDPACIDSPAGDAPVQVPLKDALWKLYNEAETVTLKIAQNHPEGLRTRFEAAALALKTKISGPKWRSTYAAQRAACN